MGIAWIAACVVRCVFSSRLRETAVAVMDLLLPARLIASRSAPGASARDVSRGGGCDLFLASSRSVLGATEEDTGASSRLWRGFCASDLRGARRTGRQAQPVKPAALLRLGVIRPRGRGCQNQRTKADEAILGSHTTLLLGTALFEEGSKLSPVLAESVVVLAFSASSEPSWAISMVPLGVVNGLTKVRALRAALPLPAMAPLVVPTIAPAEFLQLTV